MIFIYLQQYSYRLSGISVEFFAASVNYCAVRVEFFAASVNYCAVR